MLIKLSETERQELAQALCMQIDLTESIRGSLRPRWNRNMSLYYADESATSLNVVEGLAQYPFSLWRSKCDRMVGDLVSAITGADPVVQCIEEAPDGTNEQPLEDALMQLAERSGVLDILPLALIQAANTNLGIIRVRPETDAEGNVEGLTADWIEAKHFMAYPVSFERLEQCRTVGHRYYRSRYEIEDDIKAGIYYPTEIVSSDDPDAWDLLPGRFDRNNDANIANLEDGYVECWELITRARIKGKVRRVMCVIAKSSRALLACYPYGPTTEEEYAQPWYSLIRLCRSEKRIFTNDSVATSVQGYCLAAQDMMNFLVTGALTNAMPIAWIKGYVGPQQALQLKPGQILNLDREGGAGVISMPFNAENFAGILEQFKSLTDATIGVSQLATGQNLPSDTKATAINAITAADQQRKDNYLDAASVAIEDVWATLLMYLQQYQPELAARYGGAVGSCPPKLLTKQYRLEVTGRSAASNPAALMQKLQLLLGMTENPASTLDYAKVESRIVDSLSLPFNTTSLEKGSTTQVMAAANEMAEMGINPMQVIQTGLEVMEAQNAGAIGGNVPGGGLETLPGVYGGETGAGIGTLNDLQPRTSEGTASGDYGDYAIPQGGEVQV